MDVSCGFQLEQPDELIPWRISVRQLQRLLAGQQIKQISSDYFSASCISLGGVSRWLAFRFRPALWNWFGPLRLVELELYGASSNFA